MAIKRKAAEKRTAVRKDTAEKRLHVNTITNRRGIYFSGKILSSKDLSEDQNYFRDKKNQKVLQKYKPLYIIDLPKVSSKYIGETEKNFGKIFEKTKNMNGILIFDEADALFGKRSNVKDYHDKYTNLETSYLLKRLEKYKGVMFVSSNLRISTIKQYVSKLDYIICLPIKKPKRKHHN